MRGGRAPHLTERKRDLLAEAVGPVLPACVRGADVQDRAGARRLVETARPDEPPRVQVGWAEQGYTGACAEWRKGRRGWRLEVVRDPEGQIWRYAVTERPGASAACCRGGASSSAHSRAR